MNNSVSFSGAHVFVNPTKKIANATASEIAATVRQAHEMVSKELGLTIKPLRPISGKTLKKLNPDSFQKNGTLTTQGMAAFDSINGTQLGVTSNSSLNAFSKAIRNFIKNNIYNEGNGTGTISRLFDTIQ